MKWLLGAQARDEIDPVTEGARYGLSAELARALWKRACMEATHRDGERDERLAQRRFRELARHAGDDGKRRPEVGRVTRVGVEIDGVSGPLGWRESGEVRTPGRETLMAGMSVTPGAGMPAAGGSAGVPAPVMRSVDGEPVAPAAAELVARARRHGAGEPLEPGLRVELEAALGARLDGVRVHRDGTADAAAQALGARAFTIGCDVFFRGGSYDPQGREGRRLIAHEVAHTVQEVPSAHAASVAGVMAMSEPGDALEREADALADGFVERRAAIAEAQHIDGARGGRSERLIPRRGDGRPGGPGDGDVRAVRPGGPGDGDVRAVPGLVLAKRSEPSAAGHVGDAAAGNDADGGAGDATPAVSVIWFGFNTDQPREDREVQSHVHVAVAVERIAEHARAAGGAQRITLHGYASPEGDRAHNVELSLRRANKVKKLLVAAGIPGERIAVAGHGADAKHRAARWNRRVEIELTPPVTEVQFTEDEGEEVTGTPPRSGPKPLEPTTGVLTPSHWALLKKQRIAADPSRVWGADDAAKMIMERKRSGKSKTLLDYKDQWVHAHRQVIQLAAKEHDLPAWFLAGVAWAEAGGDPGFIDYLGYSYRRDIGVGSKPAAETSFGTVSIQLRRAAEELGYDPGKMTQLQLNFLINSLADAQQNLFIVGSHLHRLRDKDFPAKPAEMLTDEDLKVIGARYNRGPDLPLEKIKQNLSYGEDIVKKRARLEKLIAE